VEVLAGLVRLQLGHELALLLCREARGVTDHAQLALLVVEGEDQRADGVLLLAGSPRVYDGVHGADALDLRHPHPLARTVRRVAILGDHALGAVEPGGGGLWIVRAGRQVDGRVDELLEARAALVLGQLEEDLVVAREQVEGHEARGRRLGEHGDPRGGRMNPLAERVEVLAAAVIEQDDLPVHDVPTGREGEFGEIAGERLAVARLQDHLALVDERDAAEAVPLGLIHPLLPLGQRLRRPGELRHDRHRQLKRHDRSLTR
jgi:hypothetical protein